MMRRPLTLRHWLMAIAAVAGLATIILSVPQRSEAQSNPGEQPAVKTALPGPCLLPPAEMRRQHMDLLREERTNAVRHGVRNPEASLTRCVACHAVHDAAGRPVSYEDERHFCRACHMRVAVAPDCFSCHRSTPMAPAETENRP